MCNVQCRKCFASDDNMEIKLSHGESSLTHGESSLIMIATFKMPAAGPDIANCKLLIAGCSSFVKRLYLAFSSALLLKPPDILIGVFEVVHPFDKTGAGVDQP